MQIQINSDKTVEGHDALAQQVRATVESALARFGDRITRVEVHLSDVNGLKRGVDDKRCLLEARLARMQPLAVSHQSGTLERAVAGATKKLVSSLERTLGRLNDS